MSKAAEDIFSNTVIVEQEIPLIVDGKAAPEPLSIEWSDWVMSLFDETELVEPDEGGDAMPKVAGLRRVAQKVLGKMVFSGPVTVFPATNVDHPGRATVVFKIEFQDGTTYTEVGDSYLDNTNDKVAIYPVAVASTRAEARALRKALGINRVSFDEITTKDPNTVIRQAIKEEQAKADKDGEFKGTNLATDAQSKLINFVCDKLDIDRDKFFLNVMKVQDDKTLLKSDASASIDKLHLYRDGKEDIPTSIKK